MFGRAQKYDRQKERKELVKFFEYRFLAQKLCTEYRTERNEQEEESESPHWLKPTSFGAIVYRGDRIAIKEWQEEIGGPSGPIGDNNNNNNCIIKDGKKLDKVSLLSPPPSTERGTDRTSGRGVTNSPDNITTILFAQYDATRDNSSVPFHI